MARRNDTKSIMRILGTITYDDQEIINIFKKINIKQSSLVDINFYEEYIIEHSDRWDIISNKFYGTPFLYWTILHFNNIKDPFAELVVGEKILIIKHELITGILIELNK